MTITIQPLDAFYLTGSIILLAIAIFVYPTLRNGPKCSHRARLDSTRLGEAGKTSKRQQEQERDELDKVVFML